MSVDRHFTKTPDLLQYHHERAEADQHHIIYGPTTSPHRARPAGSSAQVPIPDPPLRGSVRTWTYLKSPGYPEMALLPLTGTQQPRFLSACSRWILLSLVTSQHSYSAISVPFASHTLTQRLRPGCLDTPQPYLLYDGASHSLMQFCKHRPLTILSFVAPEHGYALQSSPYATRHSFIYHP